MKTADVCTREVISARRSLPLTEAAKLMRENHVGAVVILDDGDSRRPVGIVTDRDLVVEVLAAELDPRTVTVGEIMPASLAVADEGDDALETLKRMRQRGVRRLPVVDVDGRLVGIVSLDDLIEIAWSALGDIVGVVLGERSLESFRRP